MQRGAGASTGSDRTAKGGKREEDTARRCIHAGGSGSGIRGRTCRVAPEKPLNERRRSGVHAKQALAGGEFFPAPGLLAEDPGFDHHDAAPPFFYVRLHFEGCPLYPPFGLFRILGRRIGNPPRGKRPVSHRSPSPRGTFSLDAARPLVYTLRRPVEALQTPFPAIPGFAASGKGIDPCSVWFS